VHLAAIGHPVVGDGTYGGNRSAVRTARPVLHAAALSFVHPATGVTMSFESPLPADLQAVIDSVGMPDDVLDGLAPVDVPESSDTTDG
jgi:23S rRNA pseudouridine1911/1915/1917 synthase